MAIRNWSFSRRQFVGRAALLGGAAMLGGCEPRLSGKFIAADNQPPDYPTVRALEAMGRILSDESSGRLDIKVYSGGQLGNEIDTLEISKFGGIDLNRVNLAPLNLIEPTTAVPGLPFIFESTAHMRRSLDSAVGDEILASLEPHGLIGLCFYDSGGRSFYNIQRPIFEPADMRGMKIRVHTSDLYIAMVNALGANAVPVSFGEVYQALSQGVIDGAENNWPSYASARHYEVARYYSLTRHLMAPEVLVMSKMSWDNLASSDKELVREAAKRSVPIMRDLWDARVEEARELILADGVAVNEVYTAPFAAAMRPVWDQFVTTPQQQSLVQRIADMGGE
jgi:tripartite ATP-independent transporter DctP family solute receptor